MLLEKNQTVYIGAGGTCSAAFVSSATGSSLASIDKSKLYLVAGAGGGGAKYADNENGTGWNCKVYVGGTGGGVRGGDGGYSVWAVATSGGTQSAGGSSTDDGGAGSYGKGGTPSSQTDGSYWCSGGRGGDGYYGGAGGFGDAHYNGVDADGGAGGSGYIGGCPSFSYAGVVYSSSTEVGKGSAANTVGKVTVTIVAQYEPSTFTISENGVETSSIYAGVSITFNVTNPDTTAYPELYHTFDIRFGSLS